MTTTTPVSEVKAKAEKKNEQNEQKQMDRPEQMEQNCEKGTYIHFRQEAAKTISTLENLKKKMKKKKIARAWKAREPKRMARTCPSDTEEERKSNVERVRQR